MRDKTSPFTYIGIRAVHVRISFLIVIAIFSAVGGLAELRNANRLLNFEENKRTQEFSQLAAEITQKRLQGEEESETLQEQALGILDKVVREGLNAKDGPKLASLNEQLAKFVSQTPPVGEDYRISALDAGPAVFALVANLGVGGPSAVRLYSKAAATVRYQLAARIDRYTQKNFFDEYLELIPASTPAIIFVTVSGRTDELQTGSFNAWQFDGQEVRLLWSSDLLPQSSYENRADGFSLSYCAEPEDEKPQECRRMSQDRYQWDGLSWKLVARKAFPAQGH